MNESENYREHGADAFWRGYRALLEKRGIEQKRIIFYHRWAEQFARAFPGVPLRSRLREHARAFLDNHRQQEHIQDCRSPRHGKPWRCCFTPISASTGVPLRPRLPRSGERIPLIPCWRFLPTPPGW